MEYQSLPMTKAFESLELMAYRDPVGVLTIGYGHTGSDVYEGLVWTEQEATDALMRDMQDAVDCVNKAVKVPLTQNQFDALCDFTFNAGRGNFLDSTMLRILNCGDYKGASEQFGKWVYAAGHILPGLVRRRQAEEILFNKP